jgi:pyruvate/2-oxoglutarate dehydrogenase complex dihydrolipoamide dehydrogenase (E3) component
LVKTFDAIVIGTGQAGAPLASRLSDEGMSVAVIERKHFGGTCVNVGCVPTKTMVASACVARMAARAAEYGVMLPGAPVTDMARVKARKDEIVMKGRTGITRWMEGLEKGTVIRGHARFTGPTTVEVDGETIEAPKIFINTGGRAAVPGMPGIDKVPYLTNSTIMDLDAVPEHLIVVGGSYIGLELAHAFRRFGAKVTVVEMGDRLIGREDPDISDAVRTILADEGIDIRLGAKCLSVEQRGGRIAMALACGEGAPEVEGSHLLLAVGRRPNSDDLGLDKAGVATDARGFITVDEQCRTNVPGIWALGDVNGRGAFTHTSYNDYQIVVGNLFDKDPLRIGDRIPCYGLFIDPPLGRVGMTEAEVRAKGIKAMSARLDMKSVGRARERGETKGFMKVVVDAQSERILGAAILGIGGDEIAHVFLAAMNAGASWQTIARGVPIHPTVSEYLPVLLGNLEAIV